MQLLNPYPELGHRSCETRWGSVEEDGGGCAFGINVHAVTQPLPPAWERGCEARLGPPFLRHSHGAGCLFMAHRLHPNGTLIDARAERAQDPLAGPLIVGALQLDV